MFFQCHESSTSHFVKSPKMSALALERGSLWVLNYMFKKQWRVITEIGKDLEYRQAANNLKWEIRSTNPSNRR